MNLFLILFFISLASIAFLIGRKVMALRGPQNQNIDENSFEMPDIEDVKHITVKRMKKYGYVALVETLRLYIRSSNFAKKTGKEIYEVLKNRLNRNRFVGDTPEKREVSKFLKMISEYKHKINKIKHKIKEEEKEK